MGSQIINTRYIQPEIFDTLEFERLYRDFFKPRNSTENFELGTDPTMFGFRQIIPRIFISENDKHNMFLYLFHEAEAKVLDHVAPYLFSGDPINFQIKPVELTRGTIPPFDDFELLWMVRLSITEVRILTMVEFEPYSAYSGDPHKHACKWCGGYTVDDSRGHCLGCGAPRNWEEFLYSAL